jgi:hypothetical protein
MRLRAATSVPLKTMAAFLLASALAPPAVAQSVHKAPAAADPLPALPSSAPFPHALEAIAQPQVSLVGVPASAKNSMLRGALAPEAGHRDLMQQPLARPRNFYPYPALPGESLSSGQLRAWLLLGLAQHGAAFFDARTTRDAMRNYQELDPFLRPFAHSAALYPVMQIAPTGLDWLAIRFATSRHRWLRRIWWLPQTAAAAGFFWSTAHNLRLPAPASR